MKTRLEFQSKSWNLVWTISVSFTNRSLCSDWM